VQGRKLVRWPRMLPVVALAGVVVVFFSGGTGEAPSHTQAVARPAHISQTLGAGDVRATPPATLEQSLRAADLLVKAGKLAPPPTLMESLQAADLLVKAGVITPPPTLAESLQAADLLVKAGKLAAPPPSLGEAILAADALVKAGKLAPPPPPLIDILRAAAVLAEAQSAPQVQDAAPPANTPPSPVSTPVPPANAADAGSAGHYDEAFTAQVFSLVNRRRQSAGLQPLTLEPRLANSAAAYTKVLADNNWFSHTGPDGSTLVARDAAAGFPFTVQLGEVLAWGSSGWTAAEIVQAWIDSPAHREQLLSPVYTRAGAGCYFTSEATLMVRCAMEFAAAE
jgi:uncharacterized protein YkwD